MKSLLDNVEARETLKTTLSLRKFNFMSTLLYSQDKTSYSTGLLSINSLSPSIFSQRHHTALQRDPSTQTGSPRRPGPAPGQRQHSHPVRAEQAERKLGDGAAEEVLRGGERESSLGRVSSRTWSGGERMRFDEGGREGGRNEKTEGES